MTCTVLYPTEAYLGVVGPHWHRYLQMGLSRAGYEVIVDSALDAACGNHTTAFDVLINEATVRCVVQWEWRAKGFENKDPAELWFAVDLDPADQGDRILPIGQCCAQKGGFRFIRELDRLRALADQHDYGWDVLAVFRAGMPGRRVDAVRTIRGHADWRSLTAVAPFRRGDTVPDDVRGGLLEYIEHYEAQCRSRIALALPGEGGVEHLDWSWRHTELLGMGVCCLSIKPNCVWVGNPQNCWIEVERDLSDMEEKINYYLAHDDERLQIAANGRAYYDAYVAPEAMARYVIAQVARHLETVDVV